MRSTTEIITDRYPGWKIISDNEVGNTDNSDSVHVQMVKIQNPDQTRELVAIIKDGKIFAIQG